MNVDTAALVGGLLFLGLTIANAVPMRAGGKNINQQNVQFFGALDNVYFRLGQ